MISSGGCVICLSAFVGHGGTTIFAATPQDGLAPAEESPARQLSVIGEELFKHFIERGIEIGGDVVIAVIDLLSDTVNLVVSYFGERPDQLEQLAERCGTVGFELFIVGGIELVEQLPVELFDGVMSCLVVC